MHWVAEKIQLIQMNANFCSCHPQINAIETYSHVLITKDILIFIMSISYGMVATIPHLRSEYQQNPTCMYRVQGVIN